VSAAAGTLRLEGVSIPRGGRTVVRDVSLRIPPGEVTTLLGANGAGKSTLVLGVAGVLRPTAGSVLLGEDDLTRSSPERIRAAGVAVVPEGRRLLPALSIEDNLRVATFALSRGERREGVALALELFPELKRRWRTQGRLLSGGEQQMLVLAQAIVSRPSILLVDELSLGLAPIVVKRLVPTIESVAERGTGVLLIEQFAHVALGLAQTAYVLEGGRIRYEGTAENLRNHPEILQTAYLTPEEEAEQAVDAPRGKTEDVADDS
jgi:branched-chain amino acid transport system ATP-binding protein